MIKNILIIDLYTGQTEVLPAEELNAATKGLKPIETEAATTYKGEEYMVKNYLNLEDENQTENEIIFSLQDDGDWGYDRIGCGEDDKGLYLFDMNDTGELLREKLYVKDGLGWTDVLEEGVAFGVFSKDGEEGDEIFYYSWEKDGDKEAWDDFCKIVLK
jgi:hypothetical protein